MLSQGRTDEEGRNTCLAGIVTRTSSQERTSRVGWADAADPLCSPPVSAGGHPARGLVVPPVHAELPGLEKRLRDQAQDDERTRLLMTTPGVGVIVALTFVAAVDDPGRFRSSKAVGAVLSDFAPSGRRSAIPPAWSGVRLTALLRPNGSSRNNIAAMPPDGASADRTHASCCRRSTTTWR